LERTSFDGHLPFLMSGFWLINIVVNVVITRLLCALKTAELPKEYSRHFAPGVCYFDRCPLTRRSGHPRRNDEQLVLTSGMALR